MRGPLSSLDYRDDLYDLYGSLSSSGYGDSGSGYGGGGKEKCCPLVVDFLCVLAILASIAGAAFFLNQVLSDSGIRNSRFPDESILWK